MIEFTEKEGSLMFSVRVLPKSSKSEIVGEYGGALKIKIKAAPVDGAANAELIGLLAKQLHISKNSVELISGQTSKQKLVRIKGIDRADLLNLINV